MSTTKAVLSLMTWIDLTGQLPRASHVDTLVAANGFVRLSPDKRRWELARDVEGFPGEELRDVPLARTAAALRIFHFSLSGVHRSGRKGRSYVRFERGGDLHADVDRDGNVYMERIVRGERVGSSFVQRKDVDAERLEAAVEEARRVR